MRLHISVCVLVGFVALTSPIASHALESGPGGASPPSRRGPEPIIPAPLFFRETWHIEGRLRALAVDLTKEHVLTNDNLELKIYGGCANNPDPNKRVWISGSPDPDQAVSNPTNLWEGMCQVPVAVTLRDKTRFVDLSGPAMIRWVVRTDGFHVVRPVVKLADGTMLVGDHADGDLNTFLFAWHEFPLLGMRWLKLDPNRITTIGSLYGPGGEAIWVHPDLRKVDEVGFVDLMPGSGHGVPGSLNVATFEVYGRPIAR